MNTGSNNTTLLGRRILLRPLRNDDFDQWSEVRVRNHDWLTQWEPMRQKGSPDVSRDRATFALRCHARDREWQLGTAFGFGIFVDGKFAGEVNINSVQRGPFQNAYVGYWIDQSQAGHGYVPEGVVLVFRHAFDVLNLHRLQISIVPRNARSLRVAEKLKLRNEGVALKYLEINGVWEDHARFGFTKEDWFERQDELTTKWL